MRRGITLFLIIVISFLMQTTLFQALSFAGIVPNLLVIITSSFGFMRGSREGMIVGFFCGLLIDIFFGFYLGVYALLYLYIGFFNGFFRKWFYPDDLRLPMTLIGISDIVCNLLIYFVLFLMRGRTNFQYYFTGIVIPEFVYTMLITIVLYYILLKINIVLEIHERKGAIKFDV